MHRHTEAVKDDVTAAAHQLQELGAQQQQMLRQVGMVSEKSKRAAHQQRLRREAAEQSAQNARKENSR
jgi:hypothetical protein